MGKWIGRRQSIGIGKESTWGTGVSPTYWLNVVNFDFFDVPERALSTASFGRITGGDQAPLALIHSEGEIEAELGDNSFGLILLAALGTVSTTGPTDTAAYTHEFSLQNDNAHDSLSIVTTDPIGDLIYEGAKIDTLTLNITPNTILTWVANFMAKGSAGSSATASYSSENKFVGRNLNFKIASLTSGLGVASVTKLKSLTLTIEKNAEVSATLSTLHPEDIVNKLFSVKGSIELDYEDRTLFGYITDGSYKALRIQLICNTLVTGAATTYSTFTLDLSKVDFENWSGDFSNDEIVTQTLEFNALYDAGLNDNVVNACTLINSASSY